MEHQWLRSYPGDCGIGADRSRRTPRAVCRRYRELPAKRASEVEAALQSGRLGDNAARLGNDRLLAVNRLARLPG